MQKGLEINMVVPMGVRMKMVVKLRAEIYVVGRRSEQTDAGENDGVVGRCGDSESGAGGRENLSGVEKGSLTNVSAAKFLPARVWW